MNASQAAPIPPPTAPAVPEGLFARLWTARHFTLHLALAELRARFRRSYIGILWAMLQPLLLTLVIAVVMTAIFKQPFASFSVYVFSGLVLWEYFTNAIMIGAVALVNAEGYIKQVSLPVVIYPVKAMVYCTILFGLGLSGFALYTLAVSPDLFSLYWLYIAPLTLAMLALCTPLAIISAFINLKFRDYQQSIGIALQMLWYLSPVFIMRNIFEHPALATWTAINPIAALCDIMRAPLLEGRAPDARDWMVIGVYAAIFWAAALIVMARERKKVVFYF
ncbi:MAG: hypothetical protein GC131_02430 [Alphaproteobacteria bacterium]|nr:hypothetical protein [Alphaproteobacteria bacterium]